MKNIIYYIILFIPISGISSEHDIKETNTEIINSTNDKLCSSLQKRISNQPQTPLEVKVSDGISLIPNTSGRYSYPSVQGHKINRKVRWLEADFFNNGSQITASIECMFLKGICSEKLVIHNKEIDYKNNPKQEFSLDYVRNMPYFLSMVHWPFKIWPESILPIQLVGVYPFNFDGETFLFLSDNYDKKNFWVVTLKDSKAVYPSGKYKGKEHGSLDIDYVCYLNH